MIVIEVKFFLECRAKKRRYKMLAILIIFILSWDDWYNNKKKIHYEYFLAKQCDRKINIKEEGNV